MSGHVAGRIQLFAEDVTQHPFLSTKSVGAIGLDQNPTYVILDWGCTKSMGSRYAVNKFMRAAATHGLNYELIPSTSKISFANSETTSVHQAVNMWFPTKTPMFTVVDIVEQGRVPILFSLKQHESGHATKWRSENLRGLGLPSCTGEASFAITYCIDLAAILRAPARASCNSHDAFPCFFAGDNE